MESSENPRAYSFFLRLMDFGALCFYVCCSLLRNLFLSLQEPYRIASNMKKEDYVIPQSEEIIIKMERYFLATGGEGGGGDDLGGDEG